MDAPAPTAAPDEAPARAQAWIESRRTVLPASALTSGKAVASRPLRELFALAPHEQAVCFASRGTAAGHPSALPRPQPEQYLAELAA